MPSTSSLVQREFAGPDAVGFGRTSEGWADEIAQAVFDRRRLKSVAIMGLSDSGKSSLVAGLTGPAGVYGMREAWSNGQPARSAVRTGFSHGVNVVTAARLIMTAVFARIIVSDQTMIKPPCFMLAAGVLIDVVGQ